MAPRRWLTARKELVVPCTPCRGAGQVLRRGIGGRATRHTCPTCKGHGRTVHAKNLLLVMWEFYSPNYKGTPGRKEELEKLYDRCREDPEKARVELGEIEKWKRGDVDVIGNTAIVHYEIMVGDSWVPRQVEWIQVPPGTGDWFLLHEEADADVPRFAFGIAPKPEAGPEPGEEDPEAGPGADPEPKPEPPKPAPPKPAPREDPATLFTISNVSVRASEPGTFKVIGFLKNLTERSFRYVNIRVSLWKGDKLVDTTNCTIGTKLLTGGKSLAFDAFIYRDDEPDYDRIAAEVTDWTEVD